MKSSEPDFAIIVHITNKNILNEKEDGVLMEQRNSKDFLDMQNEIVSLRQHNQELMEENTGLRKKIIFYENHPWVAEGLKGEIIIAKLVHGNMTSYNCSHDIEIEYENLRLEVKLANLNIAKKDGMTKRWVWIRPFGITGRKKYDHLILLGQSDMRFKQLYKDSTSPFVIFDVPFKAVKSITSRSSGGEQIILSTNPTTVRSLRGKILYEKYQVTSKELEERYQKIIEYNNKPEAI